MIDNLKTKGKWKIQLLIAINVLSYKDCNEVGTRFFFISNQVAKAQGFKLGQKLSNYLSNPEGLN